MKTRIALTAIAFIAALSCSGQSNNFRIRTLTAGFSIASLSDTASVTNAIAFLKKTRAVYTNKGYEVQTLRIVTQNVYEYPGNKSTAEILACVKAIDRIARRDDIRVSIGELLPPDQNSSEVVAFALDLIRQTTQVHFNLPISASGRGIYANSIKAAAAIAIAISKNSAGGEGNFRFTATANCPSEIPFFPAATHTGTRSFGIGVESPNILTDVLATSDWTNAKENLKLALESKLKPVEFLAQGISKSENWNYNGIDTSPAPGLDASIGQAIETITKQPFGEPSTLRACALITEVLKNLNVKTCGYSGLMLPVIEDKVLAKRATEKRFTIQELLLFSSVSGTGLDVVPIPGDTPADAVERIYYDVAALSLKYTNKALSARLFLIPGKQAGDVVEFGNASLTPSIVMKVE